MKEKIKTTRTSTGCKDTLKYSNQQFFRKINASIKDKCKTSGIVLTDFIQTSSGIILHNLVALIAGSLAIAFMTIDIVSYNIRRYSPRTARSSLPVAV